MPSGSRDFTRKQVLQAIDDSGGIMSHIASKLGCAWHTAQKYVNKWESTRRAFQDEREKLIDVAEVECMKQIKAGDASMVRYVLSRLGKGRGYVEKQEIEVTVANVDAAIKRELAGLAADRKAANAAACACAEGGAKDKSDGA